MFKLHLKNPVSFRVQLFRSFSFTVLLSLSLTVAVCLYVVYHLKDSAYEGAHSKVILGTEQGIEIAASQIWKAVNNKLANLADLTFYSLTYYSYSLFDLGVSNKNTILVNQSYFRDFEFVNDCEVPKCPIDFGPLGSRYSLEKINGSMLFSSVSLYWRSGGGRLASLESWDRLFHLYPFIKLYIDTLSVVDYRYYNIIEYSKLKISAIYTIIKIYLNTTDYVVVRRTYPGHILTEFTMNDDDPSDDYWFQNDVTDLMGPYYDKMIDAPVMLFIAKYDEIFPSISLLTTSVVHIAVLPVSDISEVILSAIYPSDGFGALIKHETLEILTWGKNNSVVQFNESSQQMVTISEIDSNLALSLLGGKSITEYTDNDGVEWFVASVQFWELSNTNNYFTALVFAKVSTSTDILPVLKQTISTSTLFISFIVIMLTILIFILWHIALYFYTHWFTSPLNGLRNICQEIIKISEIPDIKDRQYRTLLTSPLLLTTRSDEIGQMLRSFRRMLSRLDRFTVIETKKRNKKFPSNPFYISDNVESQEFSMNNPLHSNNNNKEQYFNIKWNSLCEKLLGMPIELQTGISYENVSQNSARSSFNSALLGPVLIPPDEDEDNNNNNNSQYPWLSESFTYIITNYFTTLRSYWILASIFLFVSLGLILLSAYLEVVDNSTSWEGIASQMKIQQIQILQVVVLTRAAALQSIFEELVVTTQIATSYTTMLMNGKLTYTDKDEQRYLKSYSSDIDNYFYSSQGRDFSSYYYPEAARCFSKANCSQYHYLYETNLTSLMDLMFPSCGNTYSERAIYVALEDSGLFRRYPFISTQYSSPTSCLIQRTNIPVCAKAYKYSKCSTSASTNYTSYPPFDPRCRTWYQIAYQGGDGNKVYVSNPYVTATGGISATFSMPILATNGGILGVLGLDVNVTQISMTINKDSIFGSGYFYVVSNPEVTRVLIHPKLHSNGNSFDDELDKVEEFTTSEYKVFVNTILRNLPFLPSQGGYGSSFTYKKGGVNWVLTHAQMSIGTYNYTVICTVLDDDVSMAEVVLKTTVTEEVNNMMNSFGYGISFLVLLHIVISIVILIKITKPLNQIRNFFTSFAKGHDTFIIPDKISSLEFYLILRSFHDLIVPVRKGKESFEIGKYHDALIVYQRARRLNKLIGNRFRESVCLNNIGVVYAAMNDYETSHQYISKSIAFLESICDTPSTLTALAQRYITLSSRLNNAASLLVLNRNFTLAKEYLKLVLDSDEHHAYEQGHLYKLCILGRLLLCDIGSVSTVVEISDFILHRVNSSKKWKELLGLSSLAWNEEDLVAIKQISLCNLAISHELMKDCKLAQLHYLNILTDYAIAHPPSIARALHGLKTCFFSQERHGDILKLQLLLDNYCCGSLSIPFNISNEILNISSKNSGDHPYTVNANQVSALHTKSVSFIIHYNGNWDTINSHYSTSQNTAANNINTMAIIDSIQYYFEHSLFIMDSLMVLSNSSKKNPEKRICSIKPNINKININIPFIIKRASNIEKIESKIRSLSKYTFSDDISLLEVMVTKCITSIRTMPSDRNIIVIMTSLVNMEEFINNRSMNVDSSSLEEERISVTVVIIGISDNINNINGEISCKENTNNDNSSSSNNIYSSFSENNKYQRNGSSSKQGLVEFITFPCESPHILHFKDIMKKIEQLTNKDSIFWGGVLSLED